MPGTALAYLRISSDPTDQRLGVTRQREDVQALAEKLGVELVEVFEDNDVSATKVRRASSGWSRALAYIEEHHPTHLLGYKIDRLGRRLADLEGLDDLARATGLQVHTTAEGDVFKNPAWPLLAGVAKMEAANTSLRVKRAQEARRAKGLDAGGGYRPFGYERNRRDINPAEAAIIRELARRVIAGEALMALCRELDARGVRRASGAAFGGNPTSLRRILASPRNAGLLAHKGQVIGKGAWPAILDLETYEALQQALNRINAAYPRGGRPVTSLLGGVARCGSCQRRMTASQTGARMLVYRCLRRVGGCGKVARKRETVERYVIQQLLTTLDVEIIDIEREELQSEMRSTEHDIGDAEQRLYELRVRYARGQIDAANYYPTMDALDRRARELQKAWGQMAGRLREKTRDRAARDRWESWTHDERRAFIRSRLAAVLIHPTTTRGAKRSTVAAGEVELVPR